MVNVNLVGLAVGGVLGYVVVNTVLGKGHQSALLGAAAGAAIGGGLLAPTIPGLNFGAASFNANEFISPSIRPSTIYS